MTYRDWRPQTWPTAWWKAFCTPFAVGSTLRQAARFADALPAVLRAIFVADWDTDEARRPFEDLSVMTREVQALRAEHNFAPDTCIHDVALALRKNVDEAEFERALAKLPDDAARFWRV